MGLKRGSVLNFTNSMAAAMEQAFRDEWNLVKDVPIPEAGEQDRKIMFAAIAQGVLDYLYSHRNEIPTTNQHDTSGGHTHTLNFTIE
ncbi:MAG: hypothetical protein SV201_08515 [Pseudomonadota bacterium]|nr:hypothetical protein [Pseudomonadota bacterium]